jgi:hypothetical protein
VGLCDPTLPQKKAEGWGTHSFAVGEGREKQPQIPIRLRSFHDLRSGRAFDSAAALQSHGMTTRKWVCAIPGPSAAADEGPGAPIFLW